MKNTKILISSLIMTMLLVGSTVTCYAECIGGIIGYPDGSFSYMSQDVIDAINAHPQEGGLIGTMAANPNSFTAEEFAKYGITSVKGNPELQVPVSATQTPSQIQAVQQQAAQIQAAQQQAVAANPTADPALIYLQTLQANGYTLDANGNIVPLAK